MTKLRQALIFIADGTTVAELPGTPPELLPSAPVCVEIGYALQCKRPEQIILVRQERDDLPGHFPFEMPSEQQIVFHNSADLVAQLHTKLETQLQKYGLLSR
jgi:hypothetical protein